jgi:hypothetical protein
MGTYSSTKGLRARAAALAGQLRGGKLKLCDVLGITERELAALEHVGESHRRGGRLGDAMAVYGLLAAQDPMRGRYWRALAELGSRTGQHAEAALSYEVLALLEGREPDTARREAECWAQLGQSELARKVTELAAAVENDARGESHGTR